MMGQIYRINAFMVEKRRREKLDLTDEILERSDLLTNNNNNKMSKFAFLTSNRFWALIIGAVAMYLQTKGIIGEPEMVLIATITAGFITVKTVDRIGDSKVVSAGVAKGTVEASEVVNVPQR